MLKILENPELTFEFTLPANAAGEKPTADITVQVIEEKKLKNLSPHNRLAALIIDIKGLVDEKDKPLTYSHKLVPHLMRQPGFVGAFIEQYQNAVFWGAEKNSKGLPS